MESSEAEICSNCGRKIGDSEKAYVVDGGLICLECDGKLQSGSAFESGASDKSQSASAKPASICGSSEIEICSNCGRGIDRSEQTCVFNGEIVCAECDKKVRSESVAMPAVSTGMDGEALAESSSSKAVTVLIFTGIVVAAAVIGFVLSRYSPWSSFPFKITDIDGNIDSKGILKSIRVSIPKATIWPNRGGNNEKVLIYAVDSYYDMEKVAKEVINGRAEPSFREESNSSERELPSHYQVIGKYGGGGLRHVYTDYSGWPIERSQENAGIHGVMSLGKSVPEVVEIKLSEKSTGALGRFEVTGRRLVGVKAQIYARSGDDWTPASDVLEMVLY